jgi:hypothetical protein
MNNIEAIENNDGDIKLVRLVYDHHKSEAWIEFNSLKDPEYPNQNVMWDNDNFIFTKFYKFLFRYKDNKLKKKDEKKYSDVWPILNQYTVGELIKMLEYAKEREWYKPKEEKEVKNKKSNIEK